MSDNNNNIYDDNVVMGGETMLGDPNNNTTTKVNDMTNNLSNEQFLKSLMSLSTLQAATMAANSGINLNNLNMSGLGSNSTSSLLSSLSSPSSEEATSTLKTSPGCYQISSIDNKQQQQCGLCGKETTGKTLVGCMHSFCQSCLMQAGAILRIETDTGDEYSPSSQKALVKCPVCSHESHMSNDGIESSPMPHYASNQQFLSSKSASTSSLTGFISPPSQSNNTNDLSMKLMDQLLFNATSQSPQSPPNCQRCKSQSGGDASPSSYFSSSSEDTLSVAKCEDCKHFLCSDCARSCYEKHRVIPLSSQRSSPSRFYYDSAATDYEQQNQFIKRRQQQFEFQQQHQQQQRLIAQQQQFQKQMHRFLTIESEIGKTHDFYVKALNERREYLVKELNTIFNYYMVNQNTNRLVRPQRDNSEEEAENTGEAAAAEDNNQFINNIEFSSNYGAIQTSIRNTFGFIRYNQPSGDSQAQQQMLCNQSSSGGSMGANNLFQAPPLKPSKSANKISGSLSNLQATSSSFASMSSLYKPKPIGPPSNVAALLAHSTNAINSYFTSNSVGGGGTSPISAISNSCSNLSSQNTATTDLIEQFMSSLSTGSSSSSRSSMSASSNPLLSEFQMSYLDHAMSPRGSLLGSSTSSLTSSSSNKSAASWSNVVAANASAGNSLSSSTSNILSMLDNSFDSNNLTLISNAALSPLMDHSSRAHHSNLVLGSGGGVHGNGPAPNSSQLTLSASSNSSSTSSGSSNSMDAIVGIPLGNHQNNIMHNPTLPARSQLKRSKMIYHCKFGEFGVNDGQFTEPSGVSINADNDICVADTNSHRIQIFDREGRFKFKFGECGKREGQLLYPNRVAVCKLTGDIVVTERSPTHQIQVYNQHGVFLRKFGANILQHPRGVCVDSKGRIIVVECKVMRVLIFDLMGNVLHKFNCSKYLEFPNGVCCNDREEIFISDNRAHCIKVFNYEGQFLRQIGGEGYTNYPIGVGINAQGEVLVADNHNNFNLTVFTQNGELINSLESKVKHAQCFDVGLMDDGSIVLASKDYRIYVYRYNGTNNTLNNSLTDNCVSMSASNGINNQESTSFNASTMSSSSSSSNLLQTIAAQLNNF